MGMGKRSEKFPQGEKNHAVGMGKNGRKNFGMVRIKRGRGTCSHN
jgi:hypothetical protein